MVISAPKISYKTKRSSDYLAPSFLCEAEELGFLDLPIFKNTRNAHFFR